MEISSKTLTREEQRILYIMHIDLSWIKQRPHFLAEGLNKNFNLKVIYPRPLLKLITQKQTKMVSEPSLKTFPIIMLPLSRYFIVTILNTIIREVSLSFQILFFRPKLIWITNPVYLPYLVSKGIVKIPVVYDCMDDNPEFFKGINRKRQMEKEIFLCSLAEKIFVTSKNLFDVLVARGTDEKKIFLSRNAFGGNALAKTVSNFKESNSQLKVLYFGTVAEYIDFSLLVKVARLMKNVKFYFIGPVITATPDDDNLIFLGQMEHSQLMVEASKYDCLIMPFVKNKLIESVDPVKLYEYININKNIISIYYPEIKRFTNFVSFYNDAEELIDLLEGQISSGNIKYSLEQRMHFLESNSWDNRCDFISSNLMSYFNK
tara:strand:+ start:8895 stop:10019 length:1125 start_codon:yes stop_codon:yes gene_type:complete